MIIEVQKNILMVNNCRHFFTIFLEGKKLGKKRINFSFVKSRSIHGIVN